MVPFWRPNSMSKRSRSQSRERMVSVSAATGATCAVRCRNSAFVKGHAGSPVPYSGPQTDLRLQPLAAAPERDLGEPGRRGGGDQLRRGLRREAQAGESASAHRGSHAARETARALQAPS